MVCVRNLCFAALVSASLVSARADERRVRDAPDSTTLAKPWAVKRAAAAYVVHRRQDTAVTNAPVATDAPATDPVDPPATEVVATDPVDAGSTAVVEVPATTDAPVEQPTATDGGEQPTATEVQGPSETVVEQPSETAVQEPSETDIPVDPSATGGEATGTQDTQQATATGDEGTAAASTAEFAASTDEQAASETATEATGSETDSPDETTATDGPTQTESNAVTFLTNSNGETTATSESEATTTLDLGNTSDSGDESTSLSGISPSSTSAIPDTGIKSISNNEGPESSQVTPPDVTDPDQHVAEFQANLPETAISGEDAQEVVVLEAVMFDYFVNNDPAPVDDGDITISPNVSNCKVGVDQKVNRFRARELREGCTFVKSLEFDIHFNYIRNSTDSDRPNDLSDRVENSVSLLNGAFKPIGITFNFKSYQQYAPPDSGDNKDWSTITQFDKRLQQWQTQTHTGNAMNVNVWLVNDLRSSDDKLLNGYAAYPWDKKGQQDGIVMREDRINKDDIPSFIHEMGHWLGLRHTFREQVTKAEEDCKPTDNLLDSSVTTGLEDKMYNCEQTTCDGKTKSINNYMSFSSCRGKTPANGFSTDQKSAIFSRVIKYRRGYREGECTAEYQDSGDSAKIKRSTMQDLVDGQCPDISAAVVNLEAQPTATNAGARLGYGAVYVLAALACSMFVMM